MLEDAGQVRSPSHAERLPNSRLAIIDAGHFVWEEEPAEYASIVLDSITANSS